MNPLFKELGLELNSLINDLFGQSIEEKLIQLQKTKKEFVGEVTLVVFPLLRISKKSPEETAKIIGEALKEKSDLVDDFNVIKGFLNISISKSYWKQFFEEIISNQFFGFEAPNSQGRVMVEYSSPNTNKPLHLGHLRNNFLGDSVSRILKAAGKEVVKVQIINDRGIHICKSMLAWLKFGNEETPDSSGLKGDKLVGKYYVEFDKEYKRQQKELIGKGLTEEEAKKEAPIIKEAQEMLRKWEDGDTEVNALWKKMNQWVYDGFDVTYRNMGVSFDKLYYESDTYLIGKDKVLQHEKDLAFSRKEDGSIWIDLEAEGLDSKLLLRSDGTSVYITQDIGTAIIREEEFHCEKYYYVVGNEQDYHFKVLSLVLQKMGYDWAKGIEHLSYGMVDLPSGKMKSREGTVVDADDLMKEMRDTAEQISIELGKLSELSEDEKDIHFWNIGLAALKYFILKVDPKKRMLFDPKESVDFNGNTGPFIQYTHARIKSILRKVDFKLTEKLELSENLIKEDFDIIQYLHEFPEVLKESAESKSPALIANYSYDLVKLFNSYYQNIPSIVKEENIEIKNSRLSICFKTAETIKNCMNLLGISVPKVM